jgi:RNA polymerase primary sigma factor
MMPRPRLTIKSAFDDLDMDFDEDEDGLDFLGDDDDMDMTMVGSDDTVGLYLKEMTRVPLLSCAEEVRIAKQIVKGRAALNQLSQTVKNRQRRERLQSQVEQGILAREHLIKANTRLVVSIAKRYMGRACPSSI